uniref:Uncharacterized protein n=1 Tax=Glossina palpalis gambiensis TaxID=67801 RepID=A0A1B0C705_9MUSC
MSGLLALIVSSLMPVCSNTSRRSHSLLQTPASAGGTCGICILCFQCLMYLTYLYLMGEYSFISPITSSDNADIVVDVVTSVSVYTNVCLLKLFTLLKCSAAHSSRRIDWSHECYEN